MTSASRTQTTVTTPPENQTEEHRSGQSTDGHTDDERRDPPDGSGHVAATGDRPLERLRMIPGSGH